MQREKKVFSQKNFYMQTKVKNSIYSLIVPCSYHHISHKFFRSYNVLMCTFTYLHDYSLTRTTIIMIIFFPICRHEICNYTSSNFSYNNIAVHIANKESINGYFSPWCAKYSTLLQIQVQPRTKYSYSISFAE